MCFILLSLSFLILHLINISVSLDSVGCGIQAPNYQPKLYQLTRIIGGREAVPHSWPWLVTYNVNQEIDFYDVRPEMCGANLLRINDNHEESDMLLTAGHCVIKLRTLMTPYPETVSPDDVWVTAGNHRLDQIEIGEQTIKAAELRFHPQFKLIDSIGTGAINDLALVKLKDPIKFSDTIRPICLPNQDQDMPINKTCVAAGWGRNDTINFNMSPEALHQVLAPVHSRETCGKGWNSTYYHKDEMICAGSLLGTSGICNGDSGGMLACLETDGRYTLYGIPSFGANNSCIGAGGMVSIFARIGHYKLWIDENLKNMTSVGI